MLVVLEQNYWKIEKATPLIILKLLLGHLLVTDIGKVLLGNWWRCSKLWLFFCFFTTVHYIVPPGHHTTRLPPSIPLPATSLGSPHSLFLQDLALFCFHIWWSRPTKLASLALQKKKLPLVLYFSGPLQPRTNKLEEKIIGPELSVNSPIILCIYFGTKVLGNSAWTLMGWTQNEELIESTSEKSTTLNWNKKRLASRASSKCTNHGGKKPRTKGALRLVLTALDRRRNSLSISWQLASYLAS